MHVIRSSALNLECSTIIEVGHNFFKKGYLVFGLPRHLFTNLNDLYGN